MKLISEIELSSNKDKNVLNVSGRISIINYNKDYINDSFLNYKIIEKR